MALALATLWAMSLAGCGGHVLPEIHSDGDRLATARQLIERQDYTDAATLLKSTIDAGAGSARVDEAIVLLGTCYLRQREWVLAAEQFERIARDYPESDSSGTAAYQLGEAYFGQSRKQDFDQEFTHRAIGQWSSYLRGHAGHWQNPDAERRIMEARTRLAHKLLGTADLYRKLGYLEPARVYYRRVIDEHGDTSWRPQAELGLALVDAKDHKRAEAIARLGEIERQYPQLPVAQQAARERKRLERK